MARPGLNLLLVLVSVLLTAVSLEAGLQLVTNPGQLTSSHPTRPAFNQWHNELRFHDRYSHRPASELPRHDPLLGWDSSYQGVRARGVVEVGSPPGARAIAVGDSFVFGNEVGPDENFAAMLDRADNGFQVLNMGVPGYGIDQSYLKLREHGMALAPDVVLFGIYVGDYERTSLAFTTFAKPLFTIDGDTLRLTNQPVPGPAAELARIDAELDGRFYLAEILRNTWFKLDPFHDPAPFFEATDAVVERLLDAARAGLPRGGLLVIHIPRGESFTEPDPFHQDAHRRLLAIYQALRLDVIDLDTAFRRASATPAADFYVVREDGRVGHLNPAGHRLAAALISGRLRLPMP